MIMIINSLLILNLFLSNIPTILSEIFVYDLSNKTLADLEDQQSDFNPSIRSQGIEGYVTTTNPANACTSISPPPNLPTNGRPWIALIPRTQGTDSCTFVVKIRNAYAANFSAAIIYNYEDNLITMAPERADVGIPSTFITHTDGLLLMNKYLYNHTIVNSTPLYSIKIVPGERFRFTYYLVPVALLVLTALLGLIGFVAANWYLERRRTRRHRLPRSALKQLKTKKYVKTDPWEVCAICLDDYEEGAKLRILPCDHAYHMKCIDPWLINNRRQCPVCKRYVFPNLVHADEEQNHDHQQPTNTPTEQTPLINPNDNNSTTEDISRNRQLSDHSFLNTTSTVGPNVSFISNDLSDDEKDCSLLSRPTTTTGINYDRFSRNLRRYGSMNGSSATPGVTNVFVGSLDGTTDNTNLYASSILQDVSDIETTDDNNNEQTPSVINHLSDNPAFIDENKN